MSNLPGETCSHGNQCHGGFVNTVDVKYDVTTRVIVTYTDPFGCI